MNHIIRSAVMAVLKEAFTLVSFLGLIHCTANVSEVSCTTDYISQLNCSNTGLAPATSCLVEVECSNGEDQSNGSCEIRHPEHWCTIKPYDFDIMTDIDTNCTTRVKQMHETETKETCWPLLSFIKPVPPFNITLEETGVDFILTWSTAYSDEDNFLNRFLIYRVRLRPLSMKEPIYYEVKEDRLSQLIQKENLVKGETYIIDVQTRVNPEAFQAIWSEWSPTTKLVTEGGFLDKTQGWYCLLLLMMIPVVFLICTKMWANKLQFSSIPNPRDFFKPLYHTYEGDFKRWVGPVMIFSSVDLQEKSTSLKVMCEKNRIPPKLHGRKTEDLCNSVNIQGSGSFFLQDLSFHNSLGILGNTIHGTNSCPQHISIDTVTVPEEEVAKQMLPEASGILVTMQGGNSNEHWLNPVENIDMEQISLDSFGGSLGYSEDGYPHMGLDLDTADSGFLDSNCSSPVFDQGEQIKTDPLSIREVPHSNYVKQWIVQSGQ
ncbi:interleukin-21 receptor isoform X2 [Clupea harengus]|uniref:Interleukin-21 receptor isoform X2 n=1 Tax=Clupea harengus TaxID=7950 RepID=A0A6P8FLS7_CLUHA|nr:interleukin-21 receptor isoform X2 [Clupea harengus]